MNVAELVGRQGNISPVTNDMNDEGVRNRLFDPVKMEQMFWCRVGPALHSLLVCHFLHNDAKKIASVLAFRKYTGFQRLFFQPGKCVKATLVPCFQQTTLVTLDA